MEKESLLIKKPQNSPECLFNSTFFFLNRREKNIIILLVHDVSGAVRCLQKEKKCIFKVKQTNKAVTLGILALLPIPVFMSCTVCILTS